MENLVEQIEVEAEVEVEDEDEDGCVSRLKNIYFKMLYACHVPKT